MAGNAQIRRYFARGRAEMTHPYVCAICNMVKLSSGIKICSGCWEFIKKHHPGFVFGDKRTWPPWVAAAVEDQRRLQRAYERDRKYLGPPSILEATRIPGAKPGQPHYRHWGCVWPRWYILDTVLKAKREYPGAVRVLTERQFDAWVLSRMISARQEDVAEMLGITQQAVSKRLRKAEKRLREAEMAW